MSAYIVLARKWRPSQFSDIVGQTPVVRTLMNAVHGERIHHAYLFTGSRGVGKTSIARVFAKALRCENSKWEESQLTTCGSCSNCKEIAVGNSVDVIEIDGASNNGVDAVREIRENAKFLPSSGRRKIYIIDEVHMLTTGAFNALLKILEEPPEHVVFLFATTEPHKIPATILSRCQRFDFKRIAAGPIQKQLELITKSEGIKADSASLSLIAKAGEGSLRDALSLLDQVIAFSGNAITPESVRESIGLIQSQTVFGLARGVLEHKPCAALELAQQAYQQGHDLKLLAKSLVELFHAVLLAKVGHSSEQSPSGLDFTEEEWKEIHSLAQLREIEALELIFQAFHFGIDALARSPQPKAYLDVLLIKCAATDELQELETRSGEARGNEPRVSETRNPEAKAAPAPKTAIPGPTLSPSPLPKQIVTWEGFIERLKGARPLLGSLLEHAVEVDLPKMVSGQTGSLLLKFKPEDSFKKDQIQLKAFSDQLHSFCREFFGGPVVVKVLEVQSASESLAEKKNRALKEREKSLSDKALGHPMIREAKSIFGGELGPVEILSNGTAKDVHAS